MRLSTSAPTRRPNSEEITWRQRNPAPGARVGMHKKMKEKKRPERSGFNITSLTSMMFTFSRSSSGEVRIRVPFSLYSVSIGEPSSKKGGDKGHYWGTLC